MRGARRRGLRLAALAAAAGLAVAACGGGDIDSTDGGSTAASDCGALNMAVNNWVGFEASAYVVGQLAATELGCDVQYKKAVEEVSWQGFESGDVDVIIEDWGHPDLEKTYVDQQGIAVNVGPNGNVGLIGWYVPPWLAEEHPDITDWETLNGYAADFATSESDGKGQFLGGAPSFVQNDEALITNLDLNYKVVYAGSEAGLIQAFRQAEKNKDWLLGYFYAPQWFLSEVPLVRVDLPTRTDDCPVDGPDVDCDYPETVLNKFASTAFMDSGSPAADLVSNFAWTNEDQNSVAVAIQSDGMSPEDAAQQWIDENPDVWGPWLDGTSASPSTS